MPVCFDYLIIQYDGIGKKDKKTRENISIAKKLEILKELDQNKNLTAQIVAEKHGVTPSTLRGWKRKRSQLEEANYSYDISNNVNARIRVTPLDDLDEAVYIWFNATVKNGIALTGPLIMGKLFHF